MTVSIEDGRSGTISYDEKVHFPRSALGSVVGSTGDFEGADGMIQFNIDPNDPTGLSGTYQGVLLLD